MRKVVGNIVRSRNHQFYLGAIVFASFWLLSLYLVIQRRISGVPFPRNSFLNDFVTRFGDFYGTYDQWIRLGWGQVDYGLSYLPAAYFVHQFFKLFLFTPQDAIKVIQFTSLFLLVIVFRKMPHIKQLKFKYFLFCLFFFSYPIIFNISTGNLELLFFVAFALFTYFFLKGDLRYASVCLGIAAAPKGVILIFALVFFSVKNMKLRAKAIVSSVTYFVLTNLLAVLILPKGILSSGIHSLFDIYHGTLESMKKYTELMVFSDAGLNFGHSLIGAMRIIFQIPAPELESYMLILSVVLLIIALVHFVLLARSGASTYELLFCMSCYLSLCLPTSTDYRLIYFAWAFIIVLVEDSNKSLKVDGAYLTFLLSSVLVLVPKPWMYLDQQGYHSASTWLTPFLILLALLCFSRRFSPSLYPESQGRVSIDKKVEVEFWR